MKKELTIFTAIFLFLAIGMHFKEWTSHPVEHLMALPSAGAYGIGALHPLVFTVVVYVVFVLLRGVVRVFTK
jgi:Na+/H+ antiporter NhaC